MTPRPLFLEALSLPELCARFRGTLVGALVGALAATLEGTSGCGACEPEPPPLATEAAASSGESPVISPPPAPTAPTHGDRDAIRLRVPCRAVVVEGRVDRVSEIREPATAAEAGAPSALSANSEIPTDAWLILAESARLVVRAPRSGREVTFNGPGRARACVGSQEESWVSRGRFESTAGSGEAPGAEEWIVTPVGVLRFGAAKLAIEIGANEARAEVTSGNAFVWLPPDAIARELDGGVGSKTAEEGWVRLGLEGTVLRPKLERPPLQAARAAVVACTALARSARTLAAALLERAKEGDRDASPTQATQATQQVIVRRLARAACAVAALRVDDLPDAAGLASTSLRDALSASVRNAERAWSELPVDPLRELRDE